MGSPAEALVASNLTRTFGSLTAVQRVSFVIPKGQSVGLLGPNGAGKTTTFRMLAGTLGPSAGTVRVLGFDLLHDGLTARQQIGYMPENAPLHGELTVRQYLSFRGRLSGRLTGNSELDRAITKAVRLTHLEGTLARTIARLSKGYRQRVALAAALLGDPPVLLLDEPTAGLDPNQVLETRALIREIAESRTVVLSTHVLSEVEATCSRVLLLRKGQLIRDSSLEELRREVAGRRAQLLLRGPSVELLPLLDRLLQTNEYQVDETEEGTLVVFSETTDRPLPVVVEAVTRAGLQVLACGPVRVVLDEAFAELTRDPVLQDAITSRAQDTSKASGNDE